MQVLRVNNACVCVCAAWCPPVRPRPLLGLPLTPVCAPRIPVAQPTFPYYPSIPKEIGNALVIKTLHVAPQVNFYGSTIMATMTTLSGLELEFEFSNTFPEKNKDIPLFMRHGGIKGCVKLRNCGGHDVDKVKLVLR